MKVTIVRFNESTQCGYFGTEAAEFTWVQLFTSNWEHGSRCRVKVVHDFAAAFTYLNKLHVGGYLSDDDYSTAWQLILDCETSVRANKQVQPLDSMRASLDFT